MLGIRRPPSFNVFIEALAIWDDLDVRAYAADAEPHVLPVVVLNGANPALAPSIIDPAGLGDDDALMRVDARCDGPTRVLRHEGRFRCARAQTAQPRPGCSCFIGDIDPEAVPRLSALVNVLGEVLSAARAAEMSRLTWALLQALVAGLDSAGDKIGRALQQLDRGDGAGRRPVDHAPGRRGADGRRRRGFAYGLERHRRRVVSGQGLVES